MFELGSFGLSDLLECSAAVRRLGAGASSMEEVATELVDYFHDRFVDKETQSPALALVRFYKTHPFGLLEPDLRRFAQASAGRVRLAETVPCLTLLGTAGDDLQWNDRRASQSHQAIPLPSAQAVESSPMIYQLVRELGLDVDQVVSPDPELIHRLDQSFGVFYVPEAEGSPHVPAQDFVRTHGIKSVLGFGGLLPSGYFYAVVMFSRSPISASTAEAFSTVALAVKLAVLPFVSGGRVFASEPAPVASSTARELILLRTSNRALDQLLDVRHESVMQQSLRLEQALQDAQDRADALARSQGALAASEARKAAILDAALDCIITMDADGRILEFNPAAEATFGYTREQALGQQLADVVIPADLREQHHAGVSRYLTTGDGPILNQRIEIEGVRRNGASFPVELTVTAVEVPTGQLFTGYLRDISARVAAEQALRETTERTEHIARTLQQSLLPPVLPEIPGMELASEYCAAGEGYEVGGDFYDVFETARGDWAIVLGDVMGKGPEAAAVTALARYTIRAAAIRARKPAAVLTVLNEAVNRQYPERFCTVAYLRLKATRQGLRLTVASGGHPPPLLRSCAGDVRPLETEGALLGPFPKWTGQEAHATLEPGDLFYLYSDGVTEARRGRDQYGRHRLSEMLRSTTGQDAESTVHAVNQAISEFADGQADDIAMIAGRVGPA